MAERPNLVVTSTGETLRVIPASANATTGDVIHLDRIVGDTAVTSALPATPMFEAQAAIDNAQGAAERVLGDQTAGGIWGLISQAVKNLTDFLWHTWAGNLILFGGVALIVTAILLHVFHSATPADPVVTPTTTVQQLKTDVKLRADGLAALGVPKEQIDTAANKTLMIDGTQIALRGQPMTDSPGLVSSSKSLRLTGATPPNHYASLRTLNSSLYLKSLTEAPGKKAVLENSAVIHGLSAENR